MAKGTPRKAVKTQKQIDAFKGAGEPYKVGLGIGLTCRVSATGGEKSFLLQFNRHGLHTQDPRHLLLFRGGYL